MRHFLSNAIYYHSGRTPTGDEDSTPMDMWNGYVNNDDRALMKVSTLTKI